MVVNPFFDVMLIIHYEFTISKALWSYACNNPLADIQTSLRTFIMISEQVE